MAVQILKNTEQIAHKNFAQNLLNRNSTPQNIPLSGMTFELVPKYPHVHTCALTVSACQWRRTWHIPNS